MRPIVVRAFLCFGALAILASARPAAAQPFHTAYFAGDPDNEITSVVRSEDGGFVAVGHFENLGRVLKLRANGALDWVRGYGPIRPVAVRAARGGGFAWIGNVPDVGVPPFPVFVLSDFAGALKRVHRIQVPGTQRVEIRALDVDPGDGSFWIGGTAWVDAVRSRVWLAHLDAQGGRIASGAFVAKLAQIRLDSLVVTPGHGAVAVGSHYPSPSADDVTLVHFFALGVDSAGKLLWSQFYEERVSRPPSQQWFVDVARDPSSTDAWVYAVGHGDRLCGIEHALPCNSLFTGAVVVQLDMATGAPGESIQIVPRNYQHTFEPTAIVRDEGRDLIAVGGAFDEAGPGLHHAVLARARMGKGWGVLGTQRYSDGSGPLDSEVADLNPLRFLSSPAAEPGFVLANRQTRTGVNRPTVLRTDADGKSDGKCEEALQLNPFNSLIVPYDISLTPAEASLETYILPPSIESLTTLPCSLVKVVEGKAAPKP